MPCMWQQSGFDKYLTFDNAKKYVEELNRKKYAGYNDWRLPTLEEDMSLMEPKENSDGLYINPIFNNVQEWIWTSDQYNASRAWVVNFSLGYCVFTAFYNGGYVRAVR